MFPRLRSLSRFWIIRKSSLFFCDFYINMTNSPPDVSIIIPCYNEENHLRASFEEIAQVMDATRYAYEVIFVDDCSRDRTREIIQGLASAHETVRHIFHEKNRGRGAAVKTGLAAARGRIAGFLDIDLEVHCRYIPGMVQAVLDGADVACGYRVYKIPFRFDDLVRDVLSVGYRFLTRMLLGLTVRDSEAGYKFFNMERGAAVAALAEADGWFWDTEVMALASYRGLRITEVPMVYIRREDKKSTVRPIHDAIEQFRMMMRFRGRCRRSLVYRSPRIYHAMVGALYRGRYAERFEAVAARVPHGASVLDVCCGDGVLFGGYLKNKNITYTGLDINETFVKAARDGGIDARRCDIQLEPALPGADVAIMQGSLYQFIPGEGDILKKLAAAARSRVILTEPVSNLAHAANPIKKRLGRSGTNPGTGPTPHRFTEETLDAALAPYRVIEKTSLCDGREMLYVIETSGTGDPSSTPS